MKLLNYYPKLGPDQASKANLLASTTAGIIFLATNLFFFNAQNMLITGLLFAGMIIDSATVPYVHSGVISRRYKSMKHSDLYFKIHVPSATIAYGAMFAFIGSLFVNRVNLLYWVFFGFWMVVYVSGIYGYIKVRDQRP